MNIKSMFVLIILAFQILSSAQSVKLTFHEGAGIDPFHIESIGQTEGFVEIWIGKMAVPGQVFKIQFDYWDKIDVVDIYLFTEDGTKRFLASSYGYSSKSWIGLHDKYARPNGYYQKIYYKVKLKKA